MNKLKLIIITLFLVNFFGLIQIPNAYLLVCLIPGIIGGIRKKPIFTKEFIILIIGLICNYCSSYYYEGQSFLHSFMICANLLYLSYYFFLVKYNIDVKTVEDSTIFLCLVFCLLYIVQFILLQYNIYIFSSLNLNNDHGIDTRFRLPASGLASLSYFIGLNGILLKERKRTSMILIVLGLSVLLIMAFRTMLAGVVLFSFIMYVKIKGFNIKILKYIFVTGIICSIIYFIPIFKSKIDYMLEKQMEGTETLNNKDYIRVITYEYYTKDKLNDPIEYFFGMGLPFPNSKLGKEQSDLAESYGIFTADWGLLGLSWNLGIIPVLVMVFYSIKVFLIKKPKYFQYLGIWMLYLLSISITTAEFYRTGNYVIQAIVLYICYKVKIKDENRNINVSQSF